RRRNGIRAYQRKTDETGKKVLTMSEPFVFSFFLFLVISRSPCQRYTLFELGHKETLFISLSA
ncbi:MAG: hypothetical protein IJE27_06110, partial [Anaerotignum sp.]|nr:hypothetical protein [Anaerotignum sp.]